MQLQLRHALSTCDILLLGKQPLIVQQNRSETWLDQSALSLATNSARELGGRMKHMCIVKAASHEGIAGYQHIIDGDSYRHERKRWVEADGMILDSPGWSGIMQTADCATVVAGNRRTGATVFVHCGRPAATVRDGQNIITRLLEVVAPQKSDRDQLEVFITGAIAGSDFKHDHNDEVRAKAQPFLDEFGPAVFADVASLALDIVQVIMLQLLAAGLRPEHITHDQLNTYAIHSLASHRRSAVLKEKRSTANTVIVVQR